MILMGEWFALLFKMWQEAMAGILAVAFLPLYICLVYFKLQLFLDFKGLWYVGNIYLLEHTLVCFIWSITFNKYKSVII